ncbi:MAG: hypothetical protein ACJ8C4_09825 [Gemmataceae bacterium]
MKKDNYSWLAGIAGIGIILLAVKDCGSSPKTPANAGTPPQFSPAGPYPPAGAANSAAAQTLAYWQGYSRIFAELVANIKGRPNQDMAAHRFAANQCRSLPTLGVDRDLVKWVLDAAEVFSLRADLLERSSDPAALIEAFARIANGEGANVAIDVSRSAQEWWALSRRVLRDGGARIRSTMTARYGIEFPQQ